MAVYGLGTTGTIVKVREGTGVIAADSATLTDTNIPPSLALNCFGLESIFVGAEIEGGTNPTITVEPLFRSSSCPDGSRWHRLTLGSPPGVNTVAAAAISSQTTVAMADDESMVELRVFGCTSVFLRISAVANPTSTTSWSILAMPGRYISSPYLQRG